MCAAQGCWRSTCACVCASRGGLRVFMPPPAMLLQRQWIEPQQLNSWPGSGRQRPGRHTCMCVCVCTRMHTCLLPACSSSGCPAPTPAQFPAPWCLGGRGEAPTGSPLLDPSRGLEQPGGGRSRLPRGAEGPSSALPAPFSPACLPVPSLPVLQPPGPELMQALGIRLNRARSCTTSPQSFPPGMQGPRTCPGLCRLAVAER